MVRILFFILLIANLSATGWLAWKTYPTFILKREVETFFDETISMHCYKNVDMFCHKLTGVISSAEIGYKFTMERLSTEPLVVQIYTPHTSYPFLDISKCMNNKVTLVAYAAQVGNKFWLHNLSQIRLVDDNEDCYPADGQEFYYMSFDEQVNWFKKYFPGRYSEACDSTTGICETVLGIGSGREMRFISNDKTDEAENG